MEGVRSSFVESNLSKDRALTPDWLDTKGISATGVVKLLLNSLSKLVLEAQLFIELLNNNSWSKEVFLFKDSETKAFRLLSAKEKLLFNLVGFKLFSSLGVLSEANKVLLEGFRSINLYERFWFKSLVEKFDKSPETTKSFKGLLSLTASRDKLLPLIDLLPSKYLKLFVTFLFSVFESTNAVLVG